jgi:hypothetical protein
MTIAIVVVFSAVLKPIFDLVRSNGCCSSIMVEVLEHPCKAPVALEHQADVMRAQVLISRGVVGHTHLDALLITSR